MRHWSIPLVVFSLGACDAPLVGQVQSAIVGGTSDTADPAVVLVVAQDNQGNESLCTGEVLSPHVVLTAAHCVDPASVGSGMSFSIFLGSDINGSQGNDQSLYVSAKSTHYDTQFNLNNLQGGHDVGIVVTSGAINVTPLAINRSPLSASARGASVRFVGYGVTSASDTNGTTAGTKRQTTTTLSDFDSSFLYFTDGRHETCEGDSGGPALMALGGQSVIAGITSFGDVNCATGGTDTNVASYLAMIDSYVTADVGSSTPPPPPPDMAQHSPPPPPPPPQGAPDMATYAASPDLAMHHGTTGHHDLGAGTSSGGEVGALCASGDDCATGLCATAGGGGYCTMSCTQGETVCPGGMQCVSSSGSAFCELPGGGASGCEIGRGRETSGLFAAFLLGVALAGLRSGRRRSRR